jgi:N-acetylmuramoyl-L-alanine amidase
LKPIFVSYNRCDFQFPWQQLAQNGFGIWFNPNPAITLNNQMSIPYALALVGYDIKDTTAAKLAFKRHFRQDSSSNITLEDKSVLAQLIQQKLSK